MRPDALRRSPALLPLLLALVLPALPACRTEASVHPARARAEVQAARREPVDAEHYALEIELDPDRESIVALCTVRLWAVEDGLRTVALDFEGLVVDEVRDGAGRLLDHVHRAGRLTVQLPRPLRRGDFAELAIRYSGRPAKGLYFAGHRAGRATQVFTQGECEDARWWFPCIDQPADRATSEVRVTMPAHWTSVAAGERIDLRVEGARRTEHWRMSFPHPPYLVTLVAGEFAVRERDHGGLPLMFLVEPGFEAWLETAFAETEAALDFLAEFSGQRYPYPKYAQACVENFPFGGMENISASTLTRKTLRDERGRRDGDSTGLVVHEAAHQWFGNLLTCRDWSHVWLNEGFATYATFLYLERTRGADVFRVAVREAQESYVASDRGENRRPMVHDVYRDPLDLFFGGHAYAGGAARLHLLRYLLGERDFLRGVRLFVADQIGRGVVTDDLRRALEEASGRDLRRVFEQWFHSPGFPVFQVETSYDRRAREVVVNVEQIQDPGGGTPAVFELPVDVEVRTTAGSRVERFELRQRRQVLRIPADEPPRWVRFDAAEAIPKELRQTRSSEEWAALAAECEHPAARREALHSLGEAFASADEARAQTLLPVLAGGLAGDAVAAVRVAAARALGRRADPLGRAPLLAAATGDPEASVRVAALAALEAFGPDAELAAAAEAAFEQGFSWNTMAAAAGLRAKTRPQDAFEWLRARLGLASPHDQLRAELLARLALLDDPRVPLELLRWTRDLGAGVQARAAAARGLGRHVRSDPEVRGVLVDLLTSRAFRLRAAALDGLAEGPTPEVLRALEAHYARSLFPPERRRIERVFQGLTP